MLISRGLLLRIGLFLFACYLLWHFGKELPDKLREIKDSRERLRKAQKDSGQDAGKAREEYRGDLIAFTLVSCLMAIALLYVIGVLAQFIGCPA